MHIDTTLITSLFWIVIFFAIFILLNLLDAYFTRRTLKAGGRELNPIVRIFGLWRVKIGLTVVLIIFLAYFPHFWLLILGPLNAVGVFVCIWNFIQYRKQRR